MVGACQLSSVLFRNKYVRYLMVFWSMLFTRFLVVDFGMLILLSF